MDGETQVYVYNWNSDEPLVHQVVPEDPSSNKGTWVLTQCGLVCTFLGDAGMMPLRHARKIGLLCSTCFEELK